MLHDPSTPTGEPDAGNLPVRFGGRGEVNPSSLPLSLLPDGALRLRRDKEERGCSFLVWFPRVALARAGPAIARLPWAIVGPPLTGFGNCEDEMHDGRREVSDAVERVPTWSF